MVRRFCLGVGLVLCACGGAEDAIAPPPGASGTGGVHAVAGAGGNAGSGGSAPNAAGASAGGGATGGGGSTPSAGTGGSTEPTAGQPGASGSGGAAAGSGTGGASTGGKGGAAQGGSGGQAVDPLEPVPVEGCPGYVKVFVPHGTCVWLHGTFTTQSEACGVAEPTPKTCGTLSAVSADTSSIVSTSAVIERFDFDNTGCPKKCN